MVFLSATHGLAEEIEVCLSDLIGEISRRAADDTPLHQCLQGLSILSSSNLVVTSHECRLTHNHLLDIFTLDALAVSQCLERDVWIILLELLQAHLVVVSLWVTEFGTALGDSSKTGLVEEYLLCLLGSIGSREAIELEHLCHVGLESLTDSYGSSIVVEVIILGTESQATLHHIVDVHGNVLLVSTETGTETYAQALHGILHLQFLELSLVLGSCNLVEERLYRSNALLVAAVDIERQLVEVGKLLLDGSSLVGLLLELIKDRVDTLVVVLSQLIETTITAVGSRQRIVLLPATGSKLIEIISRLCCLVKIAQDKSRLVLGISSQRHGCEHHHRKDKLHFHFLVIYY